MVDGAPACAKWMGDVPLDIKSASLNFFGFTTKLKLKATAATPQDLRGLGQRGSWWMVLPRAAQDGRVMCPYF